MNFSTHSTHSTQYENAGADLFGFIGALQARSSRQSGGANAAGSGGGSIYLQSAADAGLRGTVYVRNGDFSSTGETDLPPGSPYATGEVSSVTFRVSNAGRLTLTEDQQVGDIYLDSANGVLDLGFHILYVNSFPHDLGSGIVTNYGEIRWTRGTLIRFW